MSTAVTSNARPTLLFIFLDQPNSEFASRSQLAATVQRYREILAPNFSAHAGKLHRQLGMSQVVLFEALTSAMQSALAAQESLRRFNAQQDDIDKRVRFRLLLLSAQASDEAVLEALIQQAVRCEHWLKEDRIHFCDANDAKVTGAPTACRRVAVDFKHPGAPREPIYYVSEPGDPPDTQAAVGDNELEAGAYLDSTERSSYREDMFELMAETIPDPGVVPPIRVATPPVEEDLELSVPQQPPVKLKLAESYAMQGRFAGESSRPKRAPKKSSAGPRWFIAIVLLLMVGAGYYYFSPTMMKQPAKTEFIVPKERTIEEVLGTKNREVFHVETIKEPPPKGWGEIKIVTVPPHAKIWLDDRLVGQGSPTVIAKVPYANHSLKVSAPGYEDYYQLFNLAESRQQIDVRLSPNR